MIAFKKGHSPDGFENVPQEKYMELLKAVLKQDPFYAGSYHQGLSPQQLGEMLGHIMYVQKYKTVHFILDKEDNGYHLGLTIDKKEK